MYIRFSLPKNIPSSHNLIKTCSSKKVRCSSLTIFPQISNENQTSTTLIFLQFWFHRLKKVIICHKFWFFRRIQIYKFVLYIVVALFLKHILKSEIAFMTKVICSLLIFQILSEQYIFLHYTQSSIITLMSFHLIYYLRDIYIYIYIVIMIQL